MQSKSKVILLSILSFVVVSSIITTTWLIVVTQKNNIAYLKKGAVWQTGPMKNEDKSELKYENELLYFLVRVNLIMQLIKRRMVLILFMAMKIM